MFQTLHPELPARLASLQVIFMPQHFTLVLKQTNKKQECMHATLNLFPKQRPSFKKKKRNKNMSPLSVAQFLGRLISFCAILEM